ncbi:rCG36600 [Rattus norvegicus]|uniref:RCG36600 n=1 Tax=Rattus norvegicus TaxID=10116 RepID=A6JRU5_RAT|nr:rCG36600 [Rattus norvegicus]
MSWLSLPCRLANLRQALLITVPCRGRKMDPLFGGVKLTF